MNVHGIIQANKLVDGKWVTGHCVECSYCRAKGTVDSHTGSGKSLPLEVVVKKLRQRGWRIAGKVTCPACQAKFKAIAKSAKSRREQMAEKPQNVVVPIKELSKLAEAIVPVPGLREMSASDRRRIFRAIDDAWDETRNRYGGNATDHMIAETLDVPRIWVEEIRHEAFGEAGDNDAIDEAIAAVDRTVAELSTYVEQALTLAGKFEQALKDVRTHQATLLKIRSQVGRH